MGQDEENGMTREQVEQTIHDQFMTIIDRTGYVHDGSYNMDGQPEQVAQSIGRLFFDYFIGSMYDTGWEGFSDQELEAVSSLVTDMAVAQDHM